MEGFRSRPLDRGPCTFVWTGALTQKVREGGRTVNVHCLMATGVNAGGHREILRGLVAHGLSGVALVTSDDHAGPGAEPKGVGYPAISGGRLAADATGGGLRSPLGICWAVAGEGGPSPVRPKRVVRPYWDVGVGTMLL